MTGCLIRSDIMDNEQLTLYGFVGPMMGSWLSYYHPAFIMDGNMYVTMRDKWNLDDHTSYLKVKYQRDFLDKVDHEPPILIEEGDLLWNTSYELIDTAREVGVQLPENKLTAWDSGKGNWLTVGKLDDFIAYSNSVYTRVVNRLHELMMDDEDEHLIGKAFSIVNEVQYSWPSNPYEPVLGQAMERAFYYHHMGCTDEYDLVKLDVLQTFDFMDGKEFDFLTGSLEKDFDQLKAKRHSH